MKKLILLLTLTMMFGQTKLETRVYEIEDFFGYYVDQYYDWYDLIGFEIEEFAIWDRQHEYNNMRTLGYPWVFRFNKVHEYICIYWKR